MGGTGLELLGDRGRVKHRTLMTDAPYWSLLQVQGHGSRLMNELKMVAIRDDITHFHTYADNYAIGYFAKHGFTKQLSMSRDRW